MIFPWKLSLFNSTLSLDADQQVGAIDRYAPQGDYWRAEHILLGGRSRVTLILIADGEGEAVPGEAARLAVETAFACVELAGEESLPVLLKQLLRRMDEAVCKSGPANRVGVTMGAIIHNRVWLAQVGNVTRCYRVRGETAALQLTEDNHFPLGTEASTKQPRVTLHRLRRGDKLVFCSDGLFGGNLVPDTEIAAIHRYREVLGAARHLTALAMGRNVRDNVTAVVAAYGQRGRLSFHSMVLTLLSALAAIVIVALVGVFLARPANPAPKPPDLGVAVLAEGKTLRFEDLQLISPGKTIYVHPDAPIHINLKRRESPESRTTWTIPNVDIYFGAGSQVKMAAIDVEGFVDPYAGTGARFTLTEISVLRGQGLVLSQDPRTFYLWLNDPSSKTTPLLIVEGAPAAFAVEREREKATIYCLVGSCAIRRDKEISVIPAQSKVSIASIRNFRMQALSPVLLDTSDWKAWGSWCANERNSPHNPQTCQLINTED